MSAALGQRFWAGWVRSRLAIEEDGDGRLVVHHFPRDPAGAIFGGLWLCGWMGGVILVARGTPWPWTGRELLLIGGMVGIWLLCAFAVASALAARSRLIVTGDAITCDQWVVVHLIRKSIPAAAEPIEVSVQQRNRRGGPYHVIVIKGRRKTIHFGDGIDRQSLSECAARIQDRLGGQ